MRSGLSKSLSCLDDGHDKRRDAEEVQRQRAHDCTDLASIATFAIVHDSIDDAGTTEHERNDHGDEGQEETANKQVSQHHREHFNEVQVRALGVVEVDPVLVVQFLRVAAIATVREAASGWLRAREGSLVFFFVLLHFLLGEDAEASTWWCYKTRYEA